MIHTTMDHDEEVRQAPRLAFNNKDRLEKATWCGCYQCLSIMTTNSVVMYTDNGTTALCPVCGVDSIIPEATDKDKPLLMLMYEYWFGGPSLLHKERL